MSKYKLILLDVDGTTVASRPDALPSVRVVAAVQRAKAQVHVALATGRTLQLSRPVIRALGLQGPSIFNSGAEIINLTSGRKLHHQTISVSGLREAVQRALPYGYSLYTDNKQFGTHVRSASQIHTDASKLFIEAVPVRALDQLLTELRDIPGLAAYPSPSWKAGDAADIFVTHELATKRCGAEKLMALMHITKEEVAAIGDSVNDLPLLEAAGTKIAMGNAPMEVKAMADYVVPPVEDDGVAVALERFVLESRPLARRTCSPPASQHYGWLI